MAPAATNCSVEVKNGFQSEENREILPVHQAQQPRGQIAERNILWQALGLWASKVLSELLQLQFQAEGHAADIQNSI